MLALGRFARVSKQGDETGGAERFVHAGREFGEKRVAQVVDHQGDAGRGTPPQVGRGTVVHVALTFQFGFDLGPGNLVDQGAAAQDQRNRCPRDIAALRDIGERDFAR